MHTSLAQSKEPKYGHLGGTEQAAEVWTLGWHGASSKTMETCVARTSSKCMDPYVACGMEQKYAQPLTLFFLGNDLKKQGL